MSWISKPYIFIRNAILILIITFLLGEVVLQFLQVELPYQYTPQKIKQDFWIESPIVEASLDNDKYFKNDKHFNHIGTNYVANLISEYINDRDFLVEQ